MTEFNHKLLQGTFPDSLGVLILNSYQKPLECGVIPPHLKTLILPKLNSNLDVNTLPYGLEKLELSNQFKHPIEKRMLPDTLKYLKIKGMYPHEIELSALPISLEEVSIQINRQKSIFKHLTKLRVLKIKGDLFRMDIGPNDLPPSLQVLYLPYLTEKTIYSKSLPESLKVLKIKVSILGMPEIRKSSFPVGLRKLSFGSQFNTQIEPGSLPPNLKILQFSKSFKQTVRPGVIPNNLCKLVLPIVGAPWEESVYNRSFGSCTLPPSCTIVHK